MNVILEAYERCLRQGIQETPAEWLEALNTYDEGSAHWDPNIQDIQDTIRDALGVPRRGGEDVWFRDRMVTVVEALRHFEEEARTC